MRIKQQINAFFDEDSNDYVSYKYESRARSYMSIRHLSMLEVIEDLNMLGKEAGGIVLDAGCGPGILLKDLCLRGMRAVGLDMSAGMIRLAGKQQGVVREGGAPPLARGDIENLPFQGETFDLVCSAGVIEYLERDQRALKEFNRVLKPRGHLLISVTNRYAYNLIFDSLLEALKRRRCTAVVVDLLKQKMFRQGRVKKREFVIRKHTAARFKVELEDTGFKIVKGKYFFINLLPYPLDLLAPRIHDNIVISMGKIVTAAGLRAAAGRLAMGEGYIVLCRKS